VRGTIVPVGTAVLLAKCGISTLVLEGNRIVLIPQDIVPRHPEIDAALAAELEDERAGRVTPAFGSMAEFRAWRASPEGKKFAYS
jgi:hypothetical protein